MTGTVLTMNLLFFGAASFLSASDSGCTGGLLETIPPTEVEVEAALVATPGAGPTVIETGTDDPPTPCP